MVAGLGLISLYRINHYQRVINCLDSLNYQTQSLILSKQEFLLFETSDEKFYQSRQSNYLSNAEQVFNRIHRQVNFLKTYGITHKQDTALLRHLNLQLEEFMAHYNKIMELHLEKGFTTTGLIGNLRSKIHSVENAEINYNKALMLMLRRHEKDFFLRRDMQYVKKFEKDFQVFTNHLQQVQAVNQRFVIDSLLAYVREYREAFLKVVEVEKTIGLKSEEGINGRLNQLTEEIKKDLVRYSRPIHDNINKVYWQIFLIFGLGLLVLIVFLSVVVNRFIFSLTKRIRQIHQKIRELSQGRLIERFEPSGNDEIGQTQEELQVLNRRIAFASRFAAKIGEGNTGEAYTDEYKNGVLETSLEKMRLQLNAIEAEKNKSEWFNVGIAKFIDLIQKNKNDTQLLCRQVLNKLIAYIEAQAGAIFLLEATHQGNILGMTASYGNDSKKLACTELLPGEGLIGETFNKQKTILLEEIPESYLNIESGLGKGKPASLVLVPLCAMEICLGVIEIASLTKMEDYKIQLVEKITENLTHTLLMIQINEKNQSLIKEM